MLTELIPDRRSLNIPNEPKRLNIMELYPNDTGYGRISASGGTGEITMVSQLINRELRLPDCMLSTNYIYLGYIWWTLT